MTESKAVKMTHQYGLNSILKHVQNVRSTYRKTKVACIWHVHSVDMSSVGCVWETTETIQLRQGNHCAIHLMM
jgi:hypothetical protein